MAYYKLKNTTNTLGKRDMNLNTVQSIGFKDIIGVQSISINPGSEIIIEATYLPVAAQKLRADGLIAVVEIDKNAYLKLLKAQEDRNASDNKAAALAAKPVTVDAESSKFEERKKSSFKEKSK